VRRPRSQCSRPLFPVWRRTVGQVGGCGRPSVSDSCGRPPLPSFASRLGILIAYRIHSLYRQFNLRLIGIFVHDYRMGLQRVPRALAENYSAHNDLPQASWHFGPKYLELCKAPLRSPAFTAMASVSKFLNVTCAGSRLCEPGVAFPSRSVTVTLSRLAVWHLVNPPSKDWRTTRDVSYPAFAISPTRRTILSTPR